MEEKPRLEGTSRLVMHGTISVAGLVRQGVIHRRKSAELCEMHSMRIDGSARA